MAAVAVAAFSAAAFFAAAAFSGPHAWPIWDEGAAGERAAQWSLRGWWVEGSSLLSR